jgi:hypothetical protein
MSSIPICIVSGIKQELGIEVLGKGMKKMCFVLACLDMCSTLKIEELRQHF